MKSFRQIEKIVGGARARAGRVIDERILTDAGSALTNSSNNRPQALRPGPTIWRFIMESKITRYSAAAVVTLAAVLVLLGPFGTSKNGSVVWADVVEKVHQMHTVIHKEKCMFWEMGQEEPVLEADVIFMLLKNTAGSNMCLMKKGRYWHSSIFSRRHNSSLSFLLLKRSMEDCHYLGIGLTE